MESLFRRDVYIDMMLRQIYLAFGVWVKIDPKDVKADQTFSKCWMYRLTSSMQD